MANGHVRPGQSVTWRNETGAPVRSGALVPFGGGIAAKALQDIPAGQEGVVTLFQVHRFPLPPGVSFMPGELVFVANGEISTSGDVLGRFIRLDEGGWAEVLIMPLAVGGGSGGSVPTLQQIVNGENGTSTITKTTGDGHSSRVTTLTTTIDAGSINQIATVEPVIGEQTPVKTYRGNLTLGGVTFVGPYKERSRNVSSVTLSATDGKSFFNMNVGGNSGLTIEIEEEPTRRHVVALSSGLKDSFKKNLGIDTIDTRVTANETALADRYTKAETDAKIAEAMVDVDNEHFHPVTVLPDSSVAKENHEYVLVTYAQDGTTIESETHYLFYDGVFHEKQTQVSLDGYATEAYVNNALPTIDAAMSDTSENPVENRVVNTALAAKQDTLVSGTNIKTVGGQSLLGAGDIPLPSPSYIVDKPSGSSSQLGNVVQVGTLQNTDGTEYGIYEFYYRTTALPTADATIEYTLLPLLEDYTILDFVDATGVTSNGVFIGNGRTDGTNRLIVQQFSKVRKAVILRAYQDYSAQTALLKIKFIGTKTTA